MRPRVLRWGVLAAAVYVLTALALQFAGQPVFPLFDGLAPPQPYRWVSPPPERGGNNQPPLPGEGEVSLEEPIQNFFVVTEDGQAGLSGTTESFAGKPGRRAARVTIEPSDPQQIGPPPRGLVFDGNAYQFEATYGRSEEEAALDANVQVVLYYARHATVVLRATPSGWLRTKSFVVAPSLQVFTETPELGTFVAAGPPPRAVQRRSILPWIAYGAAGVALVAAGVAFFLRRSGSRKRLKRKSVRPPKRPQRKRRSR